MLLDLETWSIHATAFLAGMGPCGTLPDPSPGMLLVGQLSESTSFSSRKSLRGELWAAEMRF